MFYSLFPILTFGFGFQWYNEVGLHDNPGTPTTRVKVINSKVTCQVSK